jgi:hypothetical protein
MATLADSEMQSLSAYVHKAYGSTDYEIAGACTLLWPWGARPDRRVKGRARQAAGWAPRVGDG